MKVLIDMNLSTEWVEVLNAVLFALGQHDQEIERGALLTIDPARARIRLLSLEGDRE